MKKSDGMAAKEVEIRHDCYGPLRLMARAEGYVMFRRPRATPCCMPEKEWMALPLRQNAVVLELPVKKIEELR